MFAVYQIPLTDARPFLQLETHRLPTPAWPFPRANRDFVRGFGLVKERRRGGIQEWSGEGLYCDVARALRFKHTHEATTTLGKSKFLQVCAFRRLFVAGPSPGICVVTRLELGFGFRHKPHSNIALNGEACLLLIRRLLNQPMDLHEKPNARSLILLDVNTRLAQLYLASTTKQVAKGLRVESPPWWVTAGTPLLIIEYKIDSEVTALPKYARKVDADALALANVRLSQSRVQLNGQLVVVWFLGVTPRTDHDVLRRLRLNLARFHAERESVKQIFRLVIEKKIEITLAAQPSELLQSYLDHSIRLLTKELREGLPQSTIFQTVQQAEDLVAEGERETLLHHLSEIRGTLLKRIQSFTKPTATGNEPIYNITSDTTVVIQNPKGDITMSDIRNTIANSTVQGNVNQVVAQSITESFNVACQSDASQTLKDKLEDLTRVVTEMCKELSEAKQREVAQDLKVLVDEATSKTPRKKWYELSAEGLIDAAKSLGEIAAPVTNAVKGVLALLAP